MRRLFVTVIVISVTIVTALGCGRGPDLATARQTQGDSATDADWDDPQGSGVSSAPTGGDATATTSASEGGQRDPRYVEGVGVLEGDRGLALGDRPLGNLDFHSVQQQLEGKSGKGSPQRGPQAAEAGERATGGQQRPGGYEPRRNSDISDYQFDLIGTWGDASKSPLNGTSPPHEDSPAGQNTSAVAGADRGLNSGMGASPLGTSSAAGQNLAQLAADIADFNARLDSFKSQVSANDLQGRGAAARRELERQRATPYSSDAREAVGRLTAALATTAQEQQRASSSEVAPRKSGGQNLVTLLTGIDPVTGAPVGDLELTKAGVHVIAERSLTLPPAPAAAPGPRREEPTPGTREQLFQDINEATDAVLELPHLTGSAPNAVTVAGSALLRAAATVAFVGTSPSSVAELVPAALRILEQVSSALAVGGSSVVRLAGPLGAILSAVWSSDIGPEQAHEHIAPTSLGISPGGTEQGEQEDSFEQLDRVAPRPDVKLSGGRSGQGVKNLVGPPNSAVKGGGERIFVTNGEGKVIRDITRDRVKDIVPGAGFGPKRSPTEAERGLLDQFFGK